MTDSENEGPISFSVSVTDVNGNVARDIHTETTDSSSISYDLTLPSLVNLSFTSDNETSPYYANTGHTLRLNIETSEVVEEPMVLVGGNTVELTGQEKNWVASYLVSESDQEGIISFNLEIKDLAGNFLSDISTTLDSSEVKIDRTAPNIIGVGISSANSYGNDLSIPGDVVSVHFEVDEPVPMPEVLISGTSAQVSGSGTLWVASRTMTELDDGGEIFFSISCKDFANNSGSEVTATTDSSKVVYDKTLPEITFLSIYSDNEYTDSVAIVGDTVTLVFQASEIIHFPVLTIGGKDVTFDTLDIDQVSGNVLWEIP